MKFNSSKKDNARIYKYAVTYFRNGFILFGGWTATEVTSTIARFDKGSMNFRQRCHCRVELNSRLDNYELEQIRRIDFKSIWTRSYLQWQSFLDCWWFWKVPDGKLYSFRKEFQFFLVSPVFKDFPMLETAMNCIENEPFLENYKTYPGLFLVDNGFCKET